MKKTLKYSFYFILSTILLGEVLFGIFPAIYEKRPPYNTAELNDKFGWKPKGDYSYEGDMYSLDGSSYKIKITTDENGFRNTGRKKDSGNKIMVIGDSFTQAVEVSDDKTYYAHLERNLDIGVCSFGMAGYGTFQEYLIFQEYYRKIDPSIVILQFCSNDFIDNEVELERHSIYQVGLKRPYVTEDFKVEYDTPLNTMDQLIDKTNFLRFCKHLFIRLKQQAGIKKKNSSEQKIVEMGYDYEPYKRSLDKTERILQKIKSEIEGKSKLIVFCADHYEPQQKDIEEICERNKIDFMRFPLKKMKQVRKIKEVYSIDGFHWNKTGHMVIGEALETRIREILKF